MGPRVGEGNRYGPKAWVPGSLAPIFTSLETGPFGWLVGVVVLGIKPRMSYHWATSPF